MHPLIARIHPSHRTALGAWFLSRLLLWVLTGRDTSVMEAMAAMLEASKATPVVGLLVFQWEEAIDLLGMTSSIIGLLPILLAELMLLIATAEVYKFCRHNNLPHVAERATWLWALCPLMVFTTHDLAWSLGVALGTMAITAAARGRHYWSVAATFLAMACRPELVLLWPLIAGLGWTSFKDGRHSPQARWITAIGPAAAFMGWVGLTSMLLERPFVYDPSILVGAVLLWALPAYGLLGRWTENPSVERPVMVGFVVGLVTMVVLGI